MGSNGAAQRVLTTEWIDGVPLTKFKQNNQKKVNRLVLMFFKQVYRDGFFHADVHPGNIFITSDEKIALVDFSRVDDQTKIYLLEVIKGFLNRDYKSVAETHFRAGYVDRKFVNFSTACRAIGEPIVGKPLNHISLFLICLLSFLSLLQILKWKYNRIFCFCKKT